jgi:tetratricopeptide (TPR) repeat protein
MFRFFSPSFLRGGIAMATLLTFSAVAQEQGGQAPPAGGGNQGPSAGPGGGQTGGRDPGAGIPGQQPGRDPGSRQPFPTDQQRRDPWDDPFRNRPIFLSGKVTLDDGTPPPDSVVIEMVCNGNPRPQGYTDRKGSFSFELGRNQAMMMDATQSSMSTAPGFGGPAGGRDGMMMGGGGGISERDLMGCELRANLPGFRSDVVQLSGRRAMDRPDVGTIILHRLAKVDGFTFSGTSAYAPKNAVKAYDKGKKAIAKKKFDDAEKELKKATAEYDKYAAAWFELGVAYQMQNKLEEAKAAYKKSIEADSKYINPYGQLARLAAVERKWDEASEYSGTLIKLNPFIAPDVYFYSSVANLNLNNLDVAEEHAREAVKMGFDKKNPRVTHLLGVILAQKGQLAGAVENLRAYLQVAPKDDADRGNIENQLAEVERLLNQQQGAAGAQVAQ